MSCSTCVKMVAWLVLPVVVGWGSGCSATRATAAYLKNRAMDLVDPIPFGSGLGLGASARVSNYLQVGGLGTSRSFVYRAREFYEPIKTGYEGGISPLVYFRNIETPDSGQQGRPVLMGRTQNTPREFLLTIATLSAMIYFFFSIEHKGFVGVTARVGIWFLMITFGASFGYTVMGRIALLAARLEFLFGDWLHFIPSS